MASSLCWTSASCLHWKQAYGPSEPWEIIAGTNGKNPPHSVTYGHCLIFENTHPPHANAAPAECVSSGPAPRLNWHTLPTVCSSDSLSVQSTFSLPWLPAVAIGSLALSLERLRTPVLMQPLELMGNCGESCKKA